MKGHYVMTSKWLPLTSKVGSRENRRAWQGIVRRIKDYVGVCGVVGLLAMVPPVSEAVALIGIGALTR